MAIYLSKQNGNWNTASTWTSAMPSSTFNTNYAISAVGDAGLPPQSNGNDKIFIRHTVIYDVSFGIWGDGTTSPHSSDNTTTLRYGNLNAIWLSGGRLKCSRDINTDFVAKGAVIIGQDGWLDWGTKTDPLTTTSNFYLSADVMGSSGIVQPYFSAYLNSYNFAGTVTIYGQTKTRNTTLSLSAAQGATTVNVVSAYNWKVGDKLVFETNSVTGSNILTTQISAGYVSGSTTVPITSALNFNRSIGTNVSNFTSNVTLDSYTGSNAPCGVIVYTGQPSKNEFGYFTIKNIGTTRWFASSNGSPGIYPSYNSGPPNGIRPDAAINLNGVYGNIPLVLDGIAFDYNISRHSLLAARVAFFSPPGVGTNSINDSCYVYNTIPSTSYTLAPLLADKSAICEFNKNIVYNAGTAVGGDSVENAKYTDCSFTSEVAYSNFATTNNIVSFNNCKFKTNSSYIIDSNMTNIGTFKFANCNISLAPSTASTNLLVDFSVKRIGSYIFSNCSYTNILDSNLTLNKGKGWPTTLFYTVDVLSPNLSAFDNKRANTYYEAKSVSDIRKNGITSWRVKTENLGLSSEFFINQQIPGTINTPLKIKGNLRYDSLFAPAVNIANGSASPPSININGLGINETFTCPAIANTWYPFEFNVTPNGTGNIDVYLKGKSSATTGAMYLDGLSLYPYIQNVRWYGYVFDDNISKTLNTLTTLTENQVSAVSTVNNLDYLYDAANYWSVTNPSLTAYTDLYTQDGNILDFGSNNITLSSNAVNGFTYLSGSNTIILKTNSLSAGNNFNTITTTGTVTLSTQTLSNITINANVNQTIPSDLTSATINGILSYNVNSDYSILYTNTNVLTARNNGSGYVTIKKVNSTITDQTDAELRPYAATYLDLTLQSGYIAIYDNNGVQQYYTNSDTYGSPIELPYSATGTWTYKIARYGYKLASGSFTINSAVGGTVTIEPIYVQDIYVSDTVGNVMSYTTFYKTQQIYDYLSYYRTTSAGLSAGDLNSYISTLDIGSKNIILFDAASPAFSYDGSTITLNTLNLSGAAITTTGTISISGNSSISDITLTTNVIDQTPANLTNVNINGTLAYNTNSPATITYTDTTVDTVVNNGTGTVLIQRINSSINNATDPEIVNYAPTIINITPDGGSVAIYDNSNVRQYFIKTNSTVVLPFDATGTWSYKVAKYGFDLINQPFTINSSTGATINIVPNYIPDNFIDALEANVANYTDLNNANQIHDYLMYFQTLSTGIDFGDLEFETFGTITFTGGLALSGDASSMVSLSGSTLVLKSTYLSDDIILVSPNNITQHSGNTISDGVKLRASNLDSEIYFNNIDSITFFPTLSDRDNNTNGNITLNSATVYRFKYGSTLSGITFANHVYTRVTVGITTLLVTTAIVPGTNTIDFGVTGNLQIFNNNLRIVNQGVQKSSILLPHTTNI